MEKENFNKGYESSAKFFFYAFGGILLVILIQTITLFLPFLICFLLASILYIIILLINSNSKFKSKNHKSLKKGRKKLNLFLFLMSKREKEEILGDLEEIKESLMEDGYSSFKIRLFLFKHKCSIFIIQIKLFFTKLIRRDKSKEIDQ